MKTLEQLEKEFVALSQEIYNRGTVRFEPLYPWVLIRVVPKDQRYGSLYLPDNDGSQKQNKPLMEGIVLATWKPHWGPKRKPARFHEVDASVQIWKECEVKAGQRVLFPHFAGIPVKYMDETHYRVVRSWTWDEGGGITGIVDYQGDEEMRETLADTFKNLESVTLSGR